MDIGPTPIIASGKAAIIQYTKFLASRESKHNIMSNCLIPGWFPRKGKIERKRLHQKNYSKYSTRKNWKIRRLSKCSKFFVVR